MAKLTKEQIVKLNDDINNGTILATVHNSRYHLIVKVNPECIVIQSMESEDNDKGLLINLKDFRTELNSQRGTTETTPDDSSPEVAATQDTN